jgi:hypothetical protein
VFKQPVVFNRSAQAPNSSVPTPVVVHKRSLKAHGHVVHIDVADGVLVAEGVVADGYRLVAFDVGARALTPTHVEGCP